MNRFVYVLMGGCIDDQHVVGVFTSNKRANEMKEWLIRNDRFYHDSPDCLDVEPHKLNEVLDTLFEL